MLDRIIRFFLENKLVTVLLLLLLIAWGIATAPFNWEVETLPRDPVAVDAIPDLGKNQQIVHTTWKGRSPQDIEDQITYPLTTALLGVPGVEEIRSSSMFGNSSIYVIFEEGVDFYWSRSRILEKLNSLSPGTLPEGVQPTLGPDATALGQVYWYTLEGRDKQGDPAGGWDPQELRTLQDFVVKYALSSVKGVSEVASIGGYVKEYQVDIDPEAMRARGVTVADVMKAVKQSNLDVGASTLEINRVEYLIRGLGYVEGLGDLKEAVVKSVDHTPVRLKDIAHISYGPAERRGALDKAGAEAVGGVVVARHGANPMQVLERVKAKIEEIQPGLPEKTLDDGTLSKVDIVPFYDRSNLIQETLGTLEEALSLEVLITIIVIIVMVVNLRASILIAGMLPVAVLMCFIAMKYFGVTANIVALSGIAIAIGTMVDMGIVLSENMVKHLNEAGPGESRLEVIWRGTTEVASAVLTAVMTTVVSFLPVFTMEAAEGKLFGPLAWTKTFALIAALLLSILVLPAMAHWLFSIRVTSERFRQMINGLALIVGIVLWGVVFWAGALLFIVGVAGLGADLLRKYLPERYAWVGSYWPVLIYALLLTGFLGRAWLPLGTEAGMLSNFLFVALIIFLLLGVFSLIIRYYERILAKCLRYKKTFISIPVLLVLFGGLAWLGWNGLFGFMPKPVQNTVVWEEAESTFPGMGEEFMPELDEGSFLLMPTTMPHSGIEENKKVLRQVDMAVNAIPEVKQVVGKLGRVESALDPAPISMFENIINYKSEYKTDDDGQRIRFKVDEEGEFVRDSSGALIPDPSGKYYRQWRDHIETPDDIWQEILKVADHPGLTSAPKLQPIETRLVMLQTGMRAPMGVKVRGNDLDSIEAFAFRLEELLKKVEGMKEEAVYAEQIVGKPYLEIDVDREAIARYGIKMKKIQRYIEVAIGGIQLSTSVEGRERFPIRARYPRELRDSPEDIRGILIPTGSGENIPLGQLADIRYTKGPQVIKSENTFLQGTVLLDKEDGYAGIDVVENAKAFLKEKIEAGDLHVPAGISYEFAGDYQNQVRAEKRLSLVVPLALVIIFLILYFQFRSVGTTSMIFSSIIVAFSGGFILLWFYGAEWFLNFSLFGENLRDIFQVRALDLSVAVWVGFIALFGIATDAAVVIATYLDQLFRRDRPSDVQGVRRTVIEAGKRRVRPTLMTSATTLLALLPVISSTGKGSGIMVPMAIPSFGGMLMALITLFVIPVLYGWREERKLKKGSVDPKDTHAIKDNGT